MAKVTKYGIKRQKMIIPLSYIHFLGRRSLQNVSKVQVENMSQLS